MMVMSMSFGRYEENWTNSRQCFGYNCVSVICTLCCSEAGILCMEFVPILAVPSNLLLVTCVGGCTNFCVLLPYYSSLCLGLVIRRNKMGMWSNKVNKKICAKRKRYKYKYFVHNLAWKVCGWDEVRWLVGGKQLFLQLLCRAFVYRKDRTVEKWLWEPVMHNHRLLLG